jgi:hypothetical protein
VIVVVTALVVVTVIVWLSTVTTVFVFVPPQPMTAITIGSTPAVRSSRLIATA